MPNNALAISLAVGALFGPIGGLCAGIITYMEYSSLRLPRGAAFRDAVRAGSFAFGVFLALSAAIGWMLTGLIRW